MRDGRPGALPMDDGHWRRMADDRCSCGSGLPFGRCHGVERLPSGRPAGRALASILREIATPLLPPDAQMDPQSWTQAVGIAAVVWNLSRGPASADAAGLARLCDDLGLAGAPRAQLSALLRAAVGSSRKRWPEDQRQVASAEAVMPSRGALRILVQERSPAPAIQEPET